MQETSKLAGISFDTAEKFVLTLSGIKRARERLVCWDFRNGFEDKMRQIEPKIATVTESIQQVTSSVKLKKLFGLILAIGNYMNGGSNRGQADGFSLDVLPRLADTKGIDHLKEGRKD